MDLHNSDYDFSNGSSSTLDMTLDIEGDYLVVLALSQVSITACKINTVDQGSPVESGSAGGFYWACYIISSPTPGSSQAVQVVTSASTGLKCAFVFDTTGITSGSTYDDSFASDTAVGKSQTLSSSFGGSFSIVLLVNAYTPLVGGSGQQTLAGNGSYFAGGWMSSESDGTDYHYWNWGSSSLFAFYSISFEGEAPQGGRLKMSIGM